MQLRYLGTSCFEMVNSQGDRLIIDPYLDGNPYAAIRSDEVTSVDLVLVTHGGFDHLGQAFDICRRTGALLAASADVAFAGRLTGMDTALTFPMVSGARVAVKGFVVRGVEAHHVSITNVQGQFISGQPVGFVIWPEPQAPEFSIYHGGDTSLFSDMKLIAELYRPRVALIGLGGPVDLPHEMDAREAAMAVQWLGVKQAIPMHWIPGSGDPEAFREEVQRRSPPVRVDVLASGESLTIEP